MSCGRAYLHHSSTAGVAAEQQAARDRMSVAGSIWTNVQPKLGPALKRLGSIELSLLLDTAAIVLMLCVWVSADKSALRDSYCKANAKQHTEQDAPI